mgnify:FL=1|tara:strand:+ start:2016 stop:3203 length:1188 start_codon:yes stop_codon:yes gene_type:complete
MKTVESKDTRDGLAEKVTDEEEKKLKKIKKELDNASKMHKSQADRIADIVREELDTFYQELDERCQKGYKTHEKRKTKKMYGKTYRNCVKAEGVEDEDTLEEKKKRKKKKKKAKKRDACYHKVKARYDVWPSAYASGALVKCRKVGAKNWGKSTTKKEGLELKEMILDELRMFIDENGADDLHSWFKGGGWVQAVSGKPCARQPGQKTTPKCVSRAKRASMSKKERESAQRRKRKADPNQPKKTGAAKPTYVPTDKPKKKKSKKKESLNMQLDKDLLLSIIKEELSDITYYYHITDATYDDGALVEDVEFWDDVIEEAEYQGRKVTLNKPMKGDVKKSKVYVKNAKGNVVKVNFGDKKMKIKKSNPKRRKSFRARHNCKNPGPKWKARYWSCKAW